MRKRSSGDRVGAQMTVTVWHWILVLLVFVLLFGGGKISELARDLPEIVRNPRHDPLVAVALLLLFIVLLVALAAERWG